MPLNSAGLQATVQTTVFNALKAVQDPKIPNDATAAQRADIDQTLTDLAASIAEAMPDIIAEFLTNAEIQVTIPSGTFLVGATAPVFNPAPVVVPGTISA